MRVYAKTDIPKIKELMVEAGFRFKDEPGVVGISVVAEVLGLTVDQVRHRGEVCTIPRADRDHAERRMWKRATVLGWRRRHRT